jgi:hypothetical protein
MIIQEIVCDRIIVVRNKLLTSHSITEKKNQL